MKVNLFWGLIDFEIGEDASMVGFASAALATVLVVLMLTYGAYCTNPEHLNCIEQQMNHVTQYSSGC